MLAGQAERGLLMRPLHRQRGFNIIEIFIAVVLLGLLLALGMPQYATYLANSQIRASAEGLSTGLQFARAEAVSRNVLGGVEFRIAGNDWSVVLPVTAERAAAETLRSQSGAERMGNAAVAVTPSTATTLAFNGLGRLASPASAVTIDVSNPTGGTCMHVDASASMRCLRITVTQSGQVRMCDPLRPAGDPQAC
jgi:type IV fimbrial biogenesis protein FimT